MAWWKLYEQQFSYVGFVDRWILRIEDFQIMANEVLNITNICTNLQHSQWGSENLEMLISIYKNWPDDAHEFMKQFMEMKNDMMEENEKLIDKTELLELEEMF